MGGPDWEFYSPKSGTWFSQRINSDFPPEVGGRFFIEETVYLVYSYEIAGSDQN